MKNELTLQIQQTEKIIEEINIKHLKVQEIKTNCDLLLREVKLSSNNSKKIGASLSNIQKTSDQIC